MTSPDPGSPAVSGGILSQSDQACEDPQQADLRPFFLARGLPPHLLLPAGFSFPPLQCWE